MKRDEFLTTFGIGLAAVCTGCLTSCSKGDDSVPSGPGPVILQPSNVNTTLDLNTDLKNIGDSKVINSIIVVRLAAGNVPSSFTAVQVACTHQGISIAYNSTQGQFVCPGHGSTFSTDGTVLMNPAPTSLKKYTVSISGNTMTITA